MRSVFRASFGWALLGVGVVAGCSTPAPPPRCSTDDAGTAILGTFFESNAGTSIFALTADQNAAYVVLEAQDDPIDGSTEATMDVLRVPLECGPPSLLGSRSTPGFTSAVTGAIVAGDRVYFERPEGIFSVATTGGAITTEATPIPWSGGGDPFVVYGDGLYWIDGNGALWAVTTGGASAPRELARAPATTSSGPLWTALATDGINVYVMVDPGPGNIGAASEGTVITIPVGGGPISTLVRGQQVPGNLMVAGGSLYWTTFDSGNTLIMKLTLPIGSPTVVAPGESVVTQLTMLGTTLYWLNNGSTLRDLPEGGTPATFPTPDSFGQYQVTIAGSGAYWESSQTNTVLALRL